MGMGAMVAMQVGSAVVGMAGAAQAAKAQNEAGAYKSLSHTMSANAAAQQGVDKQFAYERSAAMARYEAKLMRDQAQKEVVTIRDAAARFRSKQVAAAAAQGVMVNSGSAKVLRDETSMLAERDALVAMYSGMEDALMKEYEADNKSKAGSAEFEKSFMQGVSSRVSAKYARKAGEMNAKATLLTGAAGAANKLSSAYSTYNKAG